ncbi:hypothetical protein MKY25_04010 [Geobacillus sp. FSL W8-0032]|uniref:hypothetical protein n=1 Tax=Geobacillus TaxID=129337 RepID=UPI00103AA64F|nr:hypothetical protein [Geobacillus icigianus]
MRDYIISRLEKRSFSLTDEEGKKRFPFEKLGWKAVCVIQSLASPAKSDGVQPWFSSGTEKGKAIQIHRGRPAWRERRFFWRNSNRAGIC